MTEAPKRSRSPVWRTLQTPSGERSPRAEMQGAREYAEAIMHAVRDWKVETVEIGRYSSGPTRSSRFEVVCCGSFSTSGGGGGQGSSSARYVSLPGPRQYTEGEVSQAIRAMTGDVCVRLDALLAKRGPATLHRDGGGWAAPKETALAYAEAVLTLGVALRDPRAERELQVVRRERLTGA